MSQPKKFANNQVNELIFVNFKSEIIKFTR